MEFFAGGERSTVVTTLRPPIVLVIVSARFAPAICQDGVTGALWQYPPDPQDVWLQKAGNKIIDVPQPEPGP